MNLLSEVALSHNQVIEFAFGVSQLRVPAIITGLCMPVCSL